MLGEMVVVELFFILFVVVVVVRFVFYFVDSFPYYGSTFIQFYKFITVRLLS